MSIEDELFSPDEFIQKNKDIKRKWFLQNLNNMRKVEKRFRKIYLDMDLEDMSEFQKGEAFFVNNLFIGKSP